MISAEQAAKDLALGAVGVIPTDTVYGIVCSAANPIAVARLYAIKNRHGKPGTLIAASVEQLESLGIPKRYLYGAQQYWPNSISVVIPTVPELQYLDDGVGTIAVRVPRNQELAALLEVSGPLLTSSANTPGNHPANTVQEAEDYFKGRVDFYLDGGDLTGNEASTIIRIVDDSVEVLRQGAVHINDAGEITP